MVEYIDSGKLNLRIYKYQVVDNIGYPTPGPLGSYVDEVLKCGIITFELPPTTPELSMQDIWSENAAALQNYFMQEMD